MGVESVHGSVWSAGCRRDRFGIGRRDFGCDTEVTEFDQKLATLVEDMRDTLRKEAGAGLAAPQVGILRRIFIADINGDGSEYKEFINPEILSATGKNDRYYEGCLSWL